MGEDSDRRAARQVRGSVKEAIGKLTGDAKAEAEGAVEKTDGKTQDVVGTEGTVRGKPRR